MHGSSSTDLICVLLYLFAVTMCIICKFSQHISLKNIHICLQFGKKVHHNMHIYTKDLESTRKTDIVSRGPWRATQNTSVFVTEMFSVVFLCLMFHVHKENL